MSQQTAYCGQSRRGASEQGFWRYRRKRCQKSFSEQNLVIRNLDKINPGCGRLCLRIGLSSAEKSTMSSLYNIRCAEVFVSAQHSQDGPLVRWLRDWRDNLTEDVGETEELIIGQTQRETRSWPCRPTMNVCQVR